MEPLCEIKKINKSFYGTQVLFDISLTVNPGDVIGLAGENGAGKSTLMKTIGGTHPPDSGQILVEGKPVPFGHPLAIQRMGVSVIYQEFSLIPQLTVAENLFMRQSAAKKQLRRIRWKELYRDSEQMLARLGASYISPGALVQDLSVANKQLVEIAKALTIHPRLLLMDEPSATLSRSETARMFQIVENLKQEGVGIIYITHRLEEFFETCNRLVVLKDGHITKECGLEGLTKESIISMMVGREVSSFFATGQAKKTDTNARPLLRIENLRSSAGTHQVNLSLYPGETLGIAGLGGAGRSELLRAICGLDDAAADVFEIDGKALKIRNVREAMRSGIAYLPEERKTQGMVPTMSVRENMSYAALKKFSNGAVIRLRDEAKACEKMIDDLHVKCEGPDQLIKNLSGGNQQKVIIGKWMLNRPRIYLMDEPTRGIDVGAKHEIYELIRRLTEEGAGVIFVSSELPELLGVSDRIAVVAGGTITGELSRAEATEEKIMQYAFTANEKERAEAV